MQASVKKAEFEEEEKHQREAQRPSPQPQRDTRIEFDGIDPGERHGLPRIAHKTGKRFQREAAKILNMDNFGWSSANTSETDLTLTEQQHSVHTPTSLSSFVRPIGKGATLPLHYVRSKRPGSDSQFEEDGYFDHAEEFAKKAWKTSRTGPMGASRLRTDAGVMGCLLASAGNLIGPASPLMSTVRPDSNRAGFNLARYVPDFIEVKDGHYSLKAGHQQQHARAMLPGGLTSSTATTPDGHHDHAFDIEAADAKLRDLKAKEQSHNKAVHFLNPELKAAAKAGGLTPVEEKPTFQAPTKKIRKDEIYIKLHRVAALLERQEFIMLLARACLMYGSPTHRMASQLEETGRILDVECQVIFIVSFVIISFSDPTSNNSTLRIIKQESGLNLSKLRQIAYLHQACMYDRISISEASQSIAEIMAEPPLYGKYTSILLAGLCSFCIGTPSFSASLLDMLVSAPLGAMIIALQIVLSGNSAISSLLEIILTAVAAFVAAVLSSTGYFCFNAVTSSSIVLLLPGWLIALAALELQNKNIVSGSIRLVWALIYSLFLGFGISLGATVWTKIKGYNTINSSDSSCYLTHSSHGSPVYLRTMNGLWNILFVPLYAICLSLKNQMKLNSKEFVAMIFISASGWSVNHFSALGFPGRSDISSALGAFTVGILGSAYSKAFHGPSFICCITAIQFQLPSGLGNGGLLNFANTVDSATATFDNLFSVAEQLLTVALGLVVGLFASTAVMSYFASRRLRAKGLMSF